MESNSFGPAHPYYGLTANGYNYLGKSRTEAMTIAVDPRVIPLGSRVLLLFHNESHKRYNGVYTARDTGGAIKGKKIDVFMGDFGLVWDEHPTTINFGRVKATAVVLN